MPPITSQKRAALQALVIDFPSLIRAAINSARSLDAPVPDRDAIGTRAGPPSGLPCMGP